MDTINMTTITLEGKEYQLDIEQAEKLGLLKEKDNKVRSLDEFEKKYRYKYGYYYNENENNFLKSSSISIGEQLTPHEAKAIAAFSKLLKLRRDWIGEWEPDWDFFNATDKYIIVSWRNNLKLEFTQIVARPLSFPTEQMAREFLETFRDLIEEAKILI